MRAPWFGLIALVLLAGCPASQSQRCKKLCQQQAACSDSHGKSEVIIDENECTSACTALERDAEGLRRVNEHARCVEQANGCDELMACR